MMVLIEVTCLRKSVQEVIKLGEGFLKDPEDVCVDKEGTLYTATRDSWIKRLHRNGSLENWKKLTGHNLLGITITKEGDLVACDTEEVRITFKKMIYIFSLQHCCLYISFLWFCRVCSRLVKIWSRF